MLSHFQLTAMDEAARPRIAVVGAGFSGTLAVVQLIAELTVRSIKADICLIDKTDRVGRGLAYDTDVDLHLLNLAAADMSALPSDRLHFYNWAKLRYPGVTPSSFLPRKLYGHYLSELFQALLAQNNGQPNRSVRVEVVKDQATSFDKERKLLQLASGRQFVVDRLILATGNFAPKNV